MTIDPRFGKARDMARARRQRQRYRRIAGVFFGVTLLTGLGLAGWWHITLTAVAPDIERATTSAADIDESASKRPKDARPSGPATMTRFIDLPGEPLRIDTRSAAQTKQPRRLPRPDSLPNGRGQGDILLIRDTMIPAGERLSVALPTQQEDFAIYRAQRHSASTATRQAPTNSTLRTLRTQPRNVAEAHALLFYHAQAATQEPTNLSNGFGALRLRPPEQRRQLYADTVLRIARPATTEEVLLREGLAAADAREVATAAREHLQLRDLTAQHIVALRWLRPQPEAASERQFVQAAFYAPNLYLGALARTDEIAHVRGSNGADSTISTGADPWIDRDLTAFQDDTETVTAERDGGAQPEPRLMDAIYGAALRQGLPPRLVGQLIMLLSESHDLDAKAGPKDRITLLRSASTSTDAMTDGHAGAELDQVLFVGIDAANAAVRCYVYRPMPEAPPACYGQSSNTKRRRSGAEASADTGSKAPDKKIDGTGAITTLVDQIIAVESAGRADAKNPLSSATGLGQFIDGTWLRMMRVYRPDLTAQHSRRELLAMRTDPALSREMVKHLASEGAAFLRARGHTITAGRLYLAHFLGMQGAHKALTADPQTDLLSLYGASVINANPFLRGKDASYVVQWAENKMSGTSGHVTVIREPNGLSRFRTMVDKLLSAG